MSEDTKKEAQSGGEKPSESSENFDPTVQISNAELAAIRQSGSQPSFSRESLAEMDRWRNSDASRQRAPTPQYTHTSVGQEEGANSDPTRSFDRARINAMLDSQRPPAEGADSQVREILDAGVADAAIVAESLADSRDESAQESPLDSAQDDANQTVDRAEDVVEHDDDLAFLNDGVFRDIFFGDTDAQTEDARQVEPEAFEEPVLSQPPVEESASDFEPLQESVPNASQPDESPAETSVPNSDEDEIANEILAPSDMPKDDYLDDPAPKKAHPLVIFCAVIGMLAICGATLGLAFPEAAFVLPSLFNALVLAAGTMLVYVSIILRP